MENNENLVVETENVVQPTEETVVEPIKMFTQEEMNAAVGKAKARERAKVEKQYERKYGDLVSVLKTGTGEEDVGKITDTFRSHYEQRGVKFTKPDYTDRDIALLAKAEANDIINAGYEDVEDELERLADIGAEKMTAREKAVFKVLVEHQQNADRVKELSSIGVTEDVYNSEDYKKFASQFNPTTPAKDVYDIYRKTTQPKKEIRTMGSIKNNPGSETGVKEYYSKEEAEKFTLDDFNKNPDLYKAVVNSSYKWK